MGEAQETALPESQPSQDAAPKPDAMAGGQAARLGLLLRKAREARGLTMDDVVQTLKFSHRQMEALEAGDFASLPGSVFVRGSVRSYARFLKLDPAPLLALLAEESPVVQPEVRPPDNMGDATAAIGVRRIPPLVALSVMLLVVAAGMVAWHFLGRSVVPESTEAASEASATKSPEPAATAAPLAPPAPAEQPAPVAVHAPAAVEAPAQALPSQPPAALAFDAKALLLSFRGRCWVEVKDASGEIIFTGQFDRGATQSVSGRPPFQVVLGSAANVDLSYDGQAIDLRPHTRAEVARLTLE